MLTRLYNLLTTLGYPFWLLHTYRKSIKEPAYRENVLQRIGFYPFLENCVWIHCVSLGETIAAGPLIKALQQHFPNTPLLITNTTATGRQSAQQLLRPQDHACFLPYDTKGSVRRMLKRAKPKVLIIMETELWPNLIMQTSRAQIPVILNNARLSQRSTRGYQRISSITQKMLGSITHICSQNQSDADHFMQIGTPAEKISVTGNIKFDLAISDEAIQKGDALRKTWGSDPIWIAASTHAGEDEIILAAHKKVREKQPTARLLIVPRHPSRFDVVFTLSKKQGFITGRVTDRTHNPSASVIVGDTMGDLMSFYQATDLAFVAGSFANVGGHNFIEPASLKKALVSGPVLHNFKHLSENLLKANALIIVKTAEDLSDSVIMLLNNPTKRAELAKNAYRVSQNNKGACAAQLALILSEIGH